MALSTYLKKMKIKQKFMVLFVGQTLILASISGMAWRAFDREQASAKTFMEDTAQIRAAAEVRYRFTHFRGDSLATLAIANQEAMVQKRVEKLKDIQKGLEEAVATLQGFAWDADERALLDPALKNLKAYVEGFPATLAAAKADGGNLEARFTAHKAEVDGARDGLAKLATLLKENAEKNLAVADEDAAATKKWLLIGLGLSILVGFSFSSYVSNQIAWAAGELEQCMGALAQGNLTRRSRLSGTDELGEIGRSLNQVLDRLITDLRGIAEASDRAASGATELNATAEEIRSSIEEVSRAAELQRQEAEGSSAAMEEMAASITSVQENTVHVEQLAQASSTAADQSRVDVDACTQAMSQIQESSEKVARITTVIAEIARQTNLLSLNAAIEAAKAGAQGKGFAVVAEEVRKLAERSGQAAREITALIQESSERVQAGAASVAAVEQGLGSIATNITQTSTNLKHIARAMDEQARTGGELARSVSTSSDMADRNAAASHQIAATVAETARTTEDLAKLAHELQIMVMRFKLS